MSLELELNEGMIVEARDRDTGTDLNFGEMDKVRRIELQTMVNALLADVNPRFTVNKIILGVNTRREPTGPIVFSNN